MTEEWIRRSCFSQTLQTVELGYGPITAPSVSATRAGSLSSACSRYLHWKKKKIKLWQTHPASAVSQDLGPIRYTAPYTLTNIQRQIIYDDVKTCPSVWGSADKLCERAPMENKQRSFSSLNPPSKHPWRQFQGTVAKLLRGGRLDINKAPTSQWYTCHIILQRTDNT